MILGSAALDRQRSSSGSEIHETRFLQRPTFLVENDTFVEFSFGLWWKSVNEITNL